METIYDDSTMAIRMFEYDFAIALEKSLKNGTPYEVKLPESCVIYIRETKNTPDNLNVTVHIGDSIVPYASKVIRIKNYSLDQLFSKRLLLFLPYYMLRFEHSPSDIFLEEYRELLERVSGDITSLSENDILDFIRQIAEHISPDEETKKEVSAMGGRVLELWSERVKREGWNEGRADERLNNIVSLLTRGGTEEQAITFLDATPDELTKAKEIIKSQAKRS